MGSTTESWLISWQPQKHSFATGQNCIRFNWLIGPDQLAIWPTSCNSQRLLDMASEQGRQLRWLLDALSKPTTAAAARGTFCNYSAFDLIMVMCSTEDNQQVHPPGNWHAQCSNNNGVHLQGRHMWSVSPQVKQMQRMKLLEKLHLASNCISFKLQETRENRACHMSCIISNKY